MAKADLWAFTDAQVRKLGEQTGLDTPVVLLKLLSWSTGEVSGIPSVAVKCVDIRRNTGGEGGSLGLY